MNAIAGAAEVARLLGVAPNTINVWLRRNLGFPEPLVVLSRGPLWDLRAVRDWARQTGRLAEDRAFSRGETPSMED